MSDEHKAEPISSSALIRVGGTNIASMNSVNDLIAVEMTAPPVHRSYVNALKASGKVKDSDLIASSLASSSAQHVQVKSIKTYSRGSSVVNKEGKKLTIIEASAGHTKKTKTPVHRVSDRKGNTWLEKETDLTISY